MKMENVILGIIGFGNMGSDHAYRIMKGDIPRMELGAICDIDDDKLKKAKEKYGDKVAYFKDYKEMLKSGKINAVLVATPHYFHPQMVIDSFAADMNVICEKPAGVYTKQVAEMNKAADKYGKVFSMMYNQRTNPLYAKARDLIQSGELGDLKRMIWIITNWFRTQAYYDSGTWRSTWSGEGGGTLINQNPHQLDLWQWICGMPKTIRSTCYYGKWHDIEVEDDVTVFAEYENGMTATYITSTGEAPGTNRLEITGTKGKIVIEDDKMKFYRNRVDDVTFCRTHPTSFGTPEVWEVNVPTSKPQYYQHNGILKNFTDAVLDGAELIAPGKEGILGLTISNAIHLSSWTGESVTLPIDEDKFYDMLQEKIKNSKVVKKEAKTGGDVDMSSSF